MKWTWKRLLWLGLRIVLGAVLLALAYRWIDWQQVLQAAAEVRAAWLLAALGSMLLSIALKIWRWRLLLDQYTVRVSHWHVAGAYLIGQAANILMPVRSGELFRFGWLRARSQKGTIPMVITIAIEKYLDLFMLAVFFIGVMPYLPVDIVQANFASILSASGVLTLLIVVGAFSGPRIGRWLSAAAAARFGWARSTIQPLAGWLEDSAWLQSPRRFLPAVAVSLVTWVVMAVTNLCVMAAVGLPLDARSAVLVMVLVYIGSVPAVVPGNIGPFHFFAMLALSIVGITGGPSAAFALFLHLLVTLPPLVLSAVFIWGDGRSPGVSVENQQAEASR